MKLHEKIYDTLQLSHFGKDNAIHMETLATIFDISQRDLRRIILEINTGKVLCNGWKQNNIIVSCNEGYFMAQTQSEIKEYIMLNYKRLKPAVQKMKYAKQLLSTNDQVAFNFDSQELEIIKEIDEMDYELVTPEKMAEILGVTMPTIRKWVQDKTIPYIKVGKLIRFRPDDVIAYFENKTKNEKK